VPKRHALHIPSTSLLIKLVVTQKNTHRFIRNSADHYRVCTAHHWCLLWTCAQPISWRQIFRILSKLFCHLQLRIPSDNFPATKTRKIFFISTMIAIFCVRHIFMEIRNYKCHSSGSKWELRMTQSSNVCLQFVNILKFTLTGDSTKVCQQLVTVTESSHRYFRQNYFRIFQNSFCVYYHLYGMP